MNNMKQLLPYIGILVVAVGLVGCADPTAKIQESNPTKGKELKDYSPMALAGVHKDMTKSMADPTRLAMIINATSRYGHRQDPFALDQSEINFDKSQAAEKIYIDGGSFGSLYELPDSKVPGEGVQPEPQPYRRLSGILIGDSVLAILEENGKSTIIRPGMMIPDTNWRVVSIDKDKAVLRREGNTLPREVEVRLEIGFPTGGGSSNPGGNPGGNPGAPGGGPSSAGNGSGNVGQGGRGRGAD